MCKRSQLHLNCLISIVTNVQFCYGKGALRLFLKCNQILCSLFLLMTKKIMLVRDKTTDEGEMRQFFVQNMMSRWVVSLVSGNNFELVFLSKNRGILLFSYFIQSRTLSVGNLAITNLVRLSNLRLIQAFIKSKCLVRFFRLFCIQDGHSIFPFNKGLLPITGMKQTPFLKTKIPFPDFKVMAPPISPNFKIKTFFNSLI